MNRGQVLRFLTIGVIAIVAAASAWRWRAADESMLDAVAASGLPPIRLPVGVVLDRGRVELGRKLFFDPILSADGLIVLPDGYMRELRALADRPNMD